MVVKRAQVVFADGKWDGKTLREWLPVAVDDVVRQFDPVKVIVFGSVARGEEGSDSDLDLLVVFDHIDKDERPELMGRVRFAISAPVPCDVIVTDVEELERRKDVNGSMFYWPTREGRVVYERPVA
jgi:predicted nucleotidyltransferase